MEHSILFKWMKKHTSSTSKSAIPKVLKCLISYPKNTKGSHFITMDIKHWISKLWTHVFSLPFGITAWCFANRQIWCLNDIFVDQTLKWKLSSLTTNTSKQLLFGIAAIMIIYSCTQKVLVKFTRTNSLLSCKGMEKLKLFRIKSFVRRLTW